MRAAKLGLIASLLTATVAFAQPSYPPGSRVGLNPPQNMVISKRFSGFENPAKASSITVIEMPAEAYKELAEGFTKEALARQGITLTAREDLTIDGRPAILVSGDQTAGGAKIRKWVFALSDPGTTAFVVAQTLSEGGYSDQEMQAALRSVALRAPLSIEEQMAALPFKLTTMGGLRPVRTLSGNSVFLTDGPLDVVKNVEQPVLVLSSAMAPIPSAAEAREQFARSALASQQSVKDVRIERAEGFRLKGQDWHEIVAKGVDASSGQPVVLLQTIRFGQGRFIRSVGIARAETRDRDLPRFRAVIDGVDGD